MEYFTWHGDNDDLLALELLGCFVGDGDAADSADGFLVLSQQIKRRIILTSCPHWSKGCT